MPTLAQSSLHTRVLKVRSRLSGPSILTELVLEQSWYFRQNRLGLRREFDLGKISDAKLMGQSLLELELT